MDGSVIVGKGEVLNKSDSTLQCWVQDDAGPTIFMLGPGRRSPPERDVDCFRGHCVGVPRPGDGDGVLIEKSKSWFKLKNGTTAEVTGSGRDLSFSSFLRGRAAVARSVIGVGGMVVGGALGGVGAYAWASGKFGNNYEMTDDEADKAGGVSQTQPRVYSADTNWGLPL